MSSEGILRFSIRPVNPLHFSLTFCTGILVRVPGKTIRPFLDSRKGFPDFLGFKLGEWLRAEAEFLLEFLHFFRLA